MTSTLSRRRVLGLSAGLAGAAVLPGCSRRHVVPLSPPAARLAGYRAAVASSWIAHGEREGAFDTFRRTVEAATDFAWLSRGDRVMVKVALNSDKPYPATTDPWAVHSMVRLLQEKGAGEVLVADKSGVEHVLVMPDRRRGSSRRCAERAGLLSAIEASGATPLFFDELDYDDDYAPAAPAGDHHWDQAIWLPRVLSEVDHIVYVPRVASHAVGGVTLGLKLAVGFLRDDNRLTFHQSGESFHRLYTEVNHVPVIENRLRLTVTSGTQVLATIGPDIGRATEPAAGLLIASEDLAGHDAVAAAWLRYNRDVLAPRGARNLDETVVRLRAAIHRGWLRRMWPDREQREIPDVPSFLPGDVFAHPAVVHHTELLGGRPDELHWQQLNTAPDTAAAEFVSGSIGV